MGIQRVNIGKDANFNATSAAGLLRQGRWQRLPGAQPGQGSPTGFQEATPAWFGSQQRIDHFKSVTALLHTCALL
jgi:hypothetical protein